MNILKFHSQGVSVEALHLPEELLLDLEQNLMLFFTGSSRNSAEILEGQDRSIEHGENGVLEALTSLKGLVPLMRDALRAGDLDSFGRLLDKSWAIKKRVSSKISTSQIDRIYEVAKQCGALGGKITGAGGGGFLLLYCEREKQPRLREVLKEFGLKEMIFHFDMAGTRVVYNDPFFDSDTRGGIRWVLSTTLDGLKA
ncbi:MAG: hypothetical protein LAP13_06855 [Acidobacteriia bacterium]|nr:hypothetical protein [Terriglobia bacterium]